MLFGIKKLLTFNPVYIMKSSFVIVAILLVIAGCKKVDYNVPAIKNAKLVLQDVPDSISFEGAGATCTSSLDLSAGGYTYGFCYSLNHNPTIPGVNSVSNNYASGSFSAIVSRIEFGKKYYIRAFVTNGFATSYSNEDSFAAPVYIYTLPAKNITARSFDISLYTMPSIAANITERGVCYSTASMPNIGKLRTISPVTDTGIINFHVTDTLKAGTTYYARSYFIAGGKPYYGSEINFKTAGYAGGSGGYIVFDKADTTNGWRYIEAAADTIKKANIIWGCNGVSIPGTLTAIGSGLGNSNAIIAGCSDTMSAAYRCRNLTLNNKTDWYLPSIDELKALYELNFDSVIKRNDTLFSSSQANANECYIIYFSDGVQRQLQKNATGAKAWAFRRF